MIIGIASGIGEGKDTFCSFFEKESKILYQNKKFSEKLKQIICLLTGCKREDLESEEFKSSLLHTEWDRIDKKSGSLIKITYRELLQKLGTDLLRNKIHQKIHINALFSDYKETDNWLITDLRFKNEFDSVKEKNGITIRIVRYMTIENWVKSKYFNQIQFKNLDDLMLKSNNLVSKLQMINFIKKSKKNFLLNEKDVNFKKLIHQSETDLNDYLNQNKFDFIINNDSDLKTLQEKIKKIVYAIESRI